ncbi:MAG: hypothetical protein ETSY1_33670 [Candidatus Entotheonella factor]|uniref:Uncharacterized protein n=1 Tax=Entotheonella factor TaxID=1429438 RepID=W4L9K7_ENTF1|nr:MAG: hypothetical protein ETSY1_33670 [Candidatus Entotheonella factor]
MVAPFGGGLGWLSTQYALAAKIIKADPQCLWPLQNGRFFLKF